MSARKILRIDHVSIAVNDYEKAVEFFTKILGATSQSNGAEGGALEYYWEIFAFIGDKTKVGNVFIPMHFAEANQLTFPSFDKYSKQPAFKYAAVNIVHKN